MRPGQPKPSKSQLLAWSQDSVTKWIINSLRRRFPEHPPDVPPKSLEWAHLKAGHEQIFRSIKQLCDYDFPEDSSGSDRQP